MCGIGGLVGWDEADEARLDQALSRMLERQSHRGPDHQGAQVVRGPPRAALGYRRLAIQDTTPAGNQPMRSRDGRITLVFNGEAYNFRALRRALEKEGVSFRGNSDTEVVLEAIARWGTEALSRIHGMYALAWCDTERRKVFLARDPLGIKPLYLAALDDGAVFASEVRSIMATGLLTPSVDPRALAGYLAYGAVQEPLTILEGVRAVPPGTVVTLDGNGHVEGTAPFWAMPRPEAGAAVGEGHLHDILSDATCRHLASDVPLAVFLSRGLDSTAIAGFARSHDAHVKAITVGLADAPEHDEAGDAHDVAKRLGIAHEVVQVDPARIESLARDWLEAMDQPSMDGFNVYLVARMAAAQGFKVALSGQGGDEVFGGYASFRVLQRMLGRRRRYALLPASVRAWAAAVRGRGHDPLSRAKAVAIARAPPDLLTLYHLHRQVMTPHELRLLGVDAEALGLESSFHVPGADGRDLLVPDDPVAAVQRLELRFYLGNQLLRDSDVYGMANSLEIRTPLLDQTLVDEVLRLPGSALLPEGSPPKHLLRKAAASFYSQAQREAPKQGFKVGLAQWLGGPLADVVEEGLDYLRAAGVVDPRGIAHVVQRFHAAPSRNGWTGLWALVALGHWLHRVGLPQQGPSARSVPPTPPAG